MSDYVSIKDLVSIKISGEWGDDPTSEYSTRVIRSTNFTNEGKLNLQKLALRDISDSKVDLKRLMPGDVIIEKSGGSPSQPVGRVVYFDVNDGNKYLCNNFTSILRPSSKIDPKYFFYGLYFLHLSKRTLAYQNKTTGIINLQLDRYLTLEKIKIPSIEDQEKIASVLDKVDLLRNQRMQSVFLFNEYIKSIFYEIFGDPVLNTKQWHRNKIEKFGEIVTGNTPPRSNPEYYSDKFIEWIKTDNILQDSVYISKATEYLSESGIKKARSVKAGSLLVACIAGSFESIGRSALTDRKVSFNQQINAIEPYETVNSVYLYWLFKLTRKYIQEHATKGMKKILTKGAFQQIEMIMPPIELQNKFAAFADEQEQLKQKMLDQIKELDNQFQALMQKAFT